MKRGQSPDSGKRSRYEVNIHANPELGLFDDPAARQIFLRNLRWVVSKFDLILRGCEFSANGVTIVLDCLDGRTCAKATDRLLRFSERELLAELPELSQCAMEASRTRDAPTLWQKPPSRRRLREIGRA
ncbi:MAG: hypothetical protein AUJ92_18975 [Armatimonadetes bacterium CG2_30_59_28]|nr:hypothetical protein [Armatimonadota bacterium]OIO90342.1 MAG: hypothetical protein AUJ92_18975 [Armatimonadetes bacterium CG2_30_59_28]PIU62348.1 MAG: hypothetical protein COS85_18670 [Armatimonadetes bacterium CG07_land_8_20_14_0_80_59_28]PIX38616.1 MAG: hypothetical protein COZ56_19945 [Armatimonadetes bacterium CG_4_8_14_3_um_filter_58_9]PIY40802.1 MAG: hypothetical protein COZ05_16670 [Armatimonadetes bacterium CG_4_10_14_3_um_filter_59_10]PJB64020.1 MAG: hypothetical protein CO095_153